MIIQRWIAISCLALAASCGGSGDSGTGPYSGGPPPAGCTPGAGTVCVVAGNQFSPAQITVSPGSTVTFNNTSGTTHNVTFTTAGSPGNVSDFSSGTRAVVFPAAGTYDYHCSIHGLSMSGVVVVQ
jgi:plastocyanin